MRSYGERELLAGQEALLSVDHPVRRMNSEASPSTGRLHETVLDPSIVAGVAVERHHLFEKRKSNHLIIERNVEYE